MVLPDCPVKTVHLFNHGLKQDDLPGTSLSMGAGGLLGLHSRYLGPKISLQAVMDLLDLATLRHPRGTRPRERQMRCPPWG